VEVHLPEFRGQMMVDRREGDRVLALRKKKPWRPITIRDLLTHTSGLLSDEQPNPEELTDQGGRMRRDKTLAEITLVVSQQPLEFEPGSQFVYSTAGFWTLKRLLEVVSNQPYDKFLEERIFRPLGMRDTFIFTGGVVPREKQDRVASPYYVENGALKRCEWPVCGGGPTTSIYSTARDMAAFYQMMLNGGTYNGVRILSPPAVEAMTTVQTGNLPFTPSSGEASPPSPTGRPVFGYGLGWFILLEPYARMPFASIGSYWHAGGMGTLGFIDPKKDLVTVFLIQRRGSAEQNVFLTMAGAAILN
jgi:CubicO group peptidase (beta-lactamase class C family)